MHNTGMDGDSFHGGRLWGLYAGIVSERNDPKGLGRVKVEIPGIFEGDSAWARPEGGGWKNWGEIKVPPLGADVYVQFVNGNVEHPVYRPAGFGLVDGESEVFPEHTDPDIYVWGFGPFRLVIDDRESDDPKTATFKVVKEVDGVEQTVVQFLFNYDDDSVQLLAEYAIGLEAAAVDVKSPQMQINGRVVTPVNKAI